MNPTREILMLCGSLRARSSNRGMLRAFQRIAPTGMRFEAYDALGTLPHFNPDLDHDPLPEPVRELRRLVAAAAAIVISTPEYAHALPGSFKNALDWLVSDPAFAGKPVAILHAARGSPSNWALDSLKEVLRTMSAEIVEEACVLVPLGSNQMDEEAMLARDEVRNLLVKSARALANWIDAGG